MAGWWDRVALQVRGEVREEPVDWLFAPERIAAIAGEDAAPEPVVEPGPRSYRPETPQEARRRWRSSSANRRLS